MCIRDSTYIMGCLEHLLREGHTTMEPKPELLAEWDAKRSARVKELVWSHWSIKHSYFKNANGDLYSISPWPLHTYQQWTKAPNTDDFIYT